MKSKANRSQETVKEKQREERELKNKRPFQYPVLIKVVMAFLDLYATM